MRRADSLEKALMLGKIEGRMRRGWQRMRWLDDITDSWPWLWASSGSWWRTGKPGMLQSLGITKSWHSRATEQQQSFLFTSGQGQIVYELNKGISVYSQTEGQGPLSQAIKFDYNNKITKAMKIKSKKQFPTWSQNWLPLCNRFHHIYYPDDLNSALVPQGYVFENGS